MATVLVPLLWADGADAQLRIGKTGGNTVLKKPLVRDATSVRRLRSDLLTAARRARLVDGVKPGVGRGVGAGGRTTDTTGERSGRLGPSDMTRVPRTKPPRVVVTPDKPKPTVPDKPDQTGTPDRDGNTKPPRVRVPPVVVIPPPPLTPDRPGRGSEPPPRVGIPQPPIALPVAPPPALGGGRRPPLPPVAVPALPPRGPVQTTPPPISAAIGGEAVANEIVFAVASTEAPGAEDEIAQRAGVRIVERLDAPLVGLRIVRGQWQASRRLPDVIAVVRADPRAIEFQGNFIYRPSQSAAASGGGLQYALAKLDLDDSHVAIGGRGVRIAVIDSGVDLAHPDLAGAQVERFDALGGAKTDTGSHGTAIAGIIAARGTVRGVAPAATLLSVRAFPSERAPSQVTTTFVLLKSIEWAMANGAGVINLSLAGPRDPLLQKAVAAMAAKGVLLVAAAGNNGVKAPPAYPAAYDHVIAVTAIDARDQLYAQANRGAYIALAAPGVDVLVPTEGKAHALQSGTSFAAAHISGVLALMLERDPTLTIEAARRALVDTAVDLGSPGRDDAFGAGRTSAAAALKALAK